MVMDMVIGCSETLKQPRKMKEQVLIFFLNLGNYLNHDLGIENEEQDNNKKQASGAKLFMAGLKAKFDEIINKKKGSDTNGNPETRNSQNVNSSGPSFLDKLKDGDEESAFMLAAAVLAVLFLTLLFLIIFR